MRLCFRLQNAVPSASHQHLLNKLYPYESMLSKEGVTAVTDAMKVSATQLHSPHLVSTLIHVAALPLRKTKPDVQDR